MEATLNVHIVQHMPDGTRWPRGHARLRVQLPGATRRGDEIANKSWSARRTVKRVSFDRCGSAAPVLEVHMGDDVVTSDEQWTAQVGLYESHGWMVTRKEQPDGSVAEFNGAGRSGPGADDLQAPAEELPPEPQ